MIIILPALKIDIQEDVYNDSELTFQEIQQCIVEFIENDLTDYGKVKARFLQK